MRRGKRVCCGSRWLGAWLCAVLALAGACAADDFFDGVAGPADEATMAAARVRIESFRKGDLQVDFRDAAGQPVAGTVHVRLVRHAFDFGVSLLGVQKQEAALRQGALGVIDELFNTVTVCNYWNVNEKQQGGPRDWSSTDADLKWALDHGKKPRFHCIFYNYPDWFSEVTANADGWWRIFDARIKAVAERYGTAIQEYDVFNEMILEKNGAKGRMYLAEWENAPVLWEPSSGKRFFELSRRYLPAARLVLLEADVAVPENDRFQEIVHYYKALAEIGTPFDYAGHQAHFYRLSFNKAGQRVVPSTYAMGRLDAGLDLLASVGKPVVITEYNPPSRNNKQPDVATQARLTDEEIAAFSVNYYTLVFSKPFVRGLTRWFIIDDLGGRGTDAGLLTKKGTRKAEYFALKTLLKETWDTQWNGSIQRGAIAFRGFYGTYEATIDGYAPVRFSCNSSGERCVTVTVRN